MKTSPVANGRQLILAALQRAQREFPRETTTLEIEILPDATLYVDVSANVYPDFTELEITGVDILKDTYRRECSLPNIAEYIAHELEKRI